MDDEYGFERPELNGSLISLEFGPAGRIYQLWAGDADQPGGEEFQFVCPPIQMGDEFTEDYFPGTVMLGARSDPNEPWVLSRNTGARQIPEAGDGSFAFEYEMSFLEDIEATGRFHEIFGPLPQIAWDLRIANRARRSIEIGELAFPLALNNVLDGFPDVGKGGQDRWNDRVYVHKAIGGAASHVFGQRLNARSPGLLIYPGEDTAWEFYNHVPASLRTPYRWEGIPVVYIHSRAVIEREGWPEWFLGHSSVVLEPGEERVYHMRFAPANRDRFDGVGSALQVCKRPSVRIFPGPVAPVNVGIGIEVTGVKPTQFNVDTEADLETDSDDEGGFCFIGPKATGFSRLTMEDTEGRQSQFQLLFIDPIDVLIDARADFIRTQQIVPDGSLAGAIWPIDMVDGSLQPAFENEFAVESSLGDALFLAEKNTFRPSAKECAVLDAYLRQFVEKWLRNPSDGSVGHVLRGKNEVAGFFGRPTPHLLVALLYQSMARAASAYGLTERSPVEYLTLAADTLTTMFVRGSLPEPLAGVPLMGQVPSVIEDLRAFGLESAATALSAQLRARDRDMARRRYGFGEDGLWTTGAFEEVYFAARRRGDQDGADRALRCAFAAKSLAPCWFWYGSDKNWSEMPLGHVHPAILDKGETCHTGSSVANGFLAFDALERESGDLAETYLRMAFGAVLSAWALVREDGGVVDFFCPDAASQHYGVSTTTGLSGIGLFLYLRHAAAWVTTVPSGSLIAFGCHVEAVDAEEGGGLLVRPWDGVGRRVVIRQTDFSVTSDRAAILEARVWGDKRRASLVLHNPTRKRLTTQVVVQGLWGKRLLCDGRQVAVEGGLFKFPVTLKASQKAEVALKVME